MHAARVLVADDNPVSLRYFADALDHGGFLVTTVEDGAAAVAAATEQTFDLLLLDLHMPHLDGVEALDRIRASGASRQAIALATTAERESPRDGDLLALGFAEVLHKPLSLATLHAAIQHHLRARSSEVPLLDDARALASSGGDVSIMTALRGLLAAELDALPAEVAHCTEARDADALRERLHRLEASAGFCGVPALSDAIWKLRMGLSDLRWPHEQVAGLLEVCTAVQAELARQPGPDAAPLSGVTNVDSMPSTRR